MQLSKYINDLLYRYDCVIVPNFGGFVTNTIGTQIDKATHTFTPPSKQVSFNINLTHNDGLLANHIATDLQISFDEASQKISKTVEQWLYEVKNSTLTLEKIGSFQYQDQQLVFEPAQTDNYLTASYGLSTVDATVILKEAAPTEKETIVIPTTAPVQKSYAKVIGTVAAVALLFVGTSYFASRQSNANELQAQQQITTQIQNASFNILDPLPTVILNVAKETTFEANETLNYHVIAGAFQDANNADKKVAELINKGFNASVIGVNKWGLTQVAYASFSDRRSATNTLYSIRKQDNKHAWLLVRE